MFNAVFKLKVPDYALQQQQRGLSDDAHNSGSVCIHYNKRRPQIVATLNKHLTSADFKLIVARLLFKNIWYNI